MSAAHTPFSRKRAICSALVGIGISVGGGFGVTWLVVRGYEWFVGDAIGPDVPAGEVQQSGNVIIAALTQYKSTHDMFPVSLDRLVPELLEALPPCGSAGHEWSYRSPTPSSFVLGTSGGKHTYPCMYFDSVKGTWLHDT